MTISERLFGNVGFFFDQMSHLNHFLDEVTPRRNGQSTKWSIGEMASRRNGFRRNAVQPPPPPQKKKNLPLETGLRWFSSYIHPVLWPRPKAFHFCWLGPKLSSVAWSTGAQLIIFFSFRFSVVLFDRPGISIRNATHCICRVLVFAFSLDLPVDREDSLTS